MIALICAASLFYGVAFDSVTTNAPSTSRIFPKNCTGQTLVQPDGKVRFMAYDRSRAGVLLGKKPWVGQIVNRRTDVWADPSMTGGERRTAFTFLDGKLRQLFLDGKIYNFPKGTPRLLGKLEDLWPKVTERRTEKGSTGDIWQKSNRLRLWYTNPNCAGFLITELSLVLLSGLFWLKKWWRLLPLLFLPISLLCLVQTGSRGAMLAFFLGAMILVLFSVHKLLTKKNILIGVVICTMGLALLSLGGGLERISSLASRPDAGNMLRIKIAKAAACMFVDAPAGWKGGNLPGRLACLNWYVHDEDHIIRTHFMYVGENGWIGGFCYIFVWLLLIILAFFGAKDKHPTSFALWVSFFFAGFFNPVQADITLWILPIFVLGIMLLKTNIIHRKRNIFHSMVLSIMLTLLGVGGFGICGKLLNRSSLLSVHAKGKTVEICGENPRVWIVEDIAVLGGWGFPGREILVAQLENTARIPVGYVHSIKDLPEKVDRLVLPGKSAAEYIAAFNDNSANVCVAKEIVFLSPSVAPDVVSDKLLAKSKIIWYAGYFAAIREPTYRQKRSWVRILPGIELYIPNWFTLACVNAM